MNFFSKLFGFKKEETTFQNQTEDKHVEPKIGQPFFTNAPSHWGIITDEFLDSNKDFSENYSENFGEVKVDLILEKRMFMVNSLVLLGGINRNLSEKFEIKIVAEYLDGLTDSKDKYATSCCIYKLFDKGILLTNGIVVDNFEKYAVFLFTKPTSIAYITTLKEKFIENGFRDLIYYCVINPESVSNPDFIELPYVGLQKESFKLKDDQSRENRKYSDYALWWTDNPDAFFGDSITYQLLSKYHQKCNDANTYILGKLGYALGRNKNDARIIIPEYDEVIIEGPEGIEIILTISDKTGINFHFPVSPKFEKYRDNFLYSFLEFSISIKNQVEESNFDRDSDIVKAEWLEQTKDVKDIESISLILSDTMIKYLN
jgi:hypothetical protein